MGNRTPTATKETAVKTSFMTFACPEWDLAQVLDVAAELGYDGVEPRMDAQHAHGIEVALDSKGRKMARTRAEAAGVEFCCLATSLRFIAVTDEAKAKLQAETVERVKLAADLGMPGLRVFGGPVPEDVSLEAALTAAADNLKAAGDVAAAAGVELWVETHDTLSRATVAARVVDAANHPAVFYNYDVMHPYRNGEDLDTTFASLGDRIHHTHWHDAGATPGKPIITLFGEGDLPLIELLTRLRDLGFVGYLSGEWFGEQLGKTPRESLEHYVTATKELLGRL